MKSQTAASRCIVGYSGRLRCALLLALASAALPAFAQDSAGYTSGPPAPVQPRPAEMMPRATQSPMMAVIYTGEHLIAVGDRGEILASNDAGHWAQVPVPVRSPLTAVSFADPRNGWAVGHDAAILHTTDGGKSWVLENFQPELEKPFLGVLAVDKDRAYAVGALGLFYETRDGGADWNEVKTPLAREAELNLFSIIRLGSGNLLIAGEQGTLLQSTDNGASWSKLKSPYDGAWFGAVPVGARGALLCGLRGNAWLNADLHGGKWRHIDTHTGEAFYGCATAAPGRAALVGNDGIIEVVDTARGEAHRVESPAAVTWSGVAAWQQGLVLAGETGMRQVDTLR